MDDAQWLFDNASRFILDASRGLAADQPLAQRRGWVRLLASMLKKAANLHDLRPWLRLIDLALEVEMLSGGEEGVDVRLQLRSRQAVLALQLGDYLAAARYYDALGEEAEALNNDLFRNEAMVGSTITAIYSRPDQINQEDAGLLLALASRLHDASLRMRARNAIAFVYYYWGQPERGISFANIAYGYWENQENLMEMARTAYTLSLLHRGSSSDTTFAKRWLNRARELYQQVGYPAQVANVANESGLLALWDGHFSEAVRWHRLALEALKHTNDNHRETLVRICLSIALIYEQQNLDEAHALLERVLTDAEQLPNTIVLKVQAYHPLGFLQAKKGDTEKALGYLAIGRELALTLEPGGFRETMLRKYDALIQVVQKGDSLDLDLQVPWLVTETKTESSSVCDPVQDLKKPYSVDSTQKP